MAKVRWAMVGTGLMADLILRDFPLSENTALKALVSRDTSKADQKLAEVGISARSLTFEQAIADLEVELKAAPAAKKKDIQASIDARKSWLDAAIKAVD